jgi:hypothetical protein
MCTYGQTLECIRRDQARSCWRFGRFGRCPNMSARGIGMLGGLGNATRCRRQQCVEAGDAGLAGEGFGQLGGLGDARKIRQTLSSIYYIGIYTSISKHNTTELPKPPKAPRSPRQTAAFRSIANRQASPPKPHTKSALRLNKSLRGFCSIATREKCASTATFSVAIRPAILMLRLSQPIRDRTDGPAQR